MRLNTPLPALTVPLLGFQRHQAPPLRALQRDCGRGEAAALADCGDNGNLTTQFRFHKLVTAATRIRGKRPTSGYSQIICRRLLCRRGRRPLKCRLPPVSTLA